MDSTPDVIVVPGGRGARSFDEDQVRFAATPRPPNRSSFAGELPLLGSAGVLDELAATTYHTAFDILRQVAPNTEQRPGERWVDNGKIVTSAGVSAGIDAALHVVGKLFGPERTQTMANTWSTNTGSRHADMTNTHMHSGRPSIITSLVHEENEHIQKEELHGHWALVIRRKRIVAASLTPPIAGTARSRGPMSAITSYHAHVYFDAARREDARQLCERAVRSST